MHNIDNLLQVPDGQLPLRVGNYHNVMVLSPHCDDESIGCGGTIVSLLEKGVNVTIVFFTCCNDERKDIREQEARSVWKRYENVELVFLNFPDGKLNQYQKDAQNQLAKYVKSEQPEMILLPWAIDSHPDHAVIFPILESLIQQQIYEGDLYFYEVFFPLLANHIVNISKLHDKKVALLEKYESQLRLNFIKTSTLLNAYRAESIGVSVVKYAEAFFVIHTSNAAVLRKLFYYE